MAALATLPTLDSRQSYRLDNHLRAAVRDALQGSGYWSLRHVDTSVSRGVVVLRGRVPSFHMKQVAQTEVLRLHQVKAIENRLEVSD